MSNQPLAARMRPTSLDEVLGQEHLLHPGSPLRLLADGKLSTSVILWGPPGVGKTTIANIIATNSPNEFMELSATSAGVADVRKILTKAEKLRKEQDLSTTLFIDEIHRFSKSQQDVLLPGVESGDITLIGATTENPSFSVITPLLSRAILLTLNPIQDQDVEKLILRAIQDPRGFDSKLTISEDALKAISKLASGDSRRSLTTLELCGNLAIAQNVTEINIEHVKNTTASALQQYDKQGDQHYDITSAFIKSMRGSDPDAAIYWLARMIEAGEDPRFIARRLIVHASEDVGMADPTVLPVAVAAAQAVQLVGLPEARINLAQATIAIATAPKSPTSHHSINKAQQDIKNGAVYPVPNHLRDAHYPGAKSLGHGTSYKYPHDYKYSLVQQQYLPDKMIGQKYYQPRNNGFEATIAKRLENIQMHVEGK